ncbi:sugar ABC transporter permease [Galbitalea sp. SE-J8]|uniref:sugar ABC transporter permease n=1 Tax=Galbitalea sp. SE-J8 TaxID=3054952 RepID=UPI00259CBC9F|nr:sugar ABC transporter permease [Galbitalea sp. SE-J8]MDM4762487.1 sugar ABC transporter permease [Galbitalea sp. SE-J8]
MTGELARVEAARPGIRSLLGALRDRVRTGDLGSAPVLIGLAVIWIVFQVLNPFFLSSENLVNLTMQSAATGTMAIGIVLVLLVGQVDLSVGSVNGLAGAIVAVGFVQLGLPLWLVVIGAVLAGSVVGVVFGVLYTRFGVPGFVITLAGLLAVLGLQLLVLGDAGSINLPFGSWIVEFGQQMFLPAWLSYLIAAACTALYAVRGFGERRRRLDAGLAASSRLATLARTAALGVLLGAVISYLDRSRGIGLMFLVFIALVTGAHIVLTRTRWGRAVYAVGGSVEAARRAGIRVDRVFVSVFVACSTLAAVGGVMAAARLAGATQSSGSGDVYLMAIAAAVIGGTSLFGGRGSAFSALTGTLVLSSITSGLTLLSLNSSVRYLVTGGVLVLAVIVDSISRRTRRAAGRA